jgi:hypothetical protein
VRGILRGKIHRTMAVWPAVTQTWSSLPGEQRLRDVQEVTSPGAAVCLVRPDKLHAARSASAARFRRWSGSGTATGLRDPHRLAGAAGEWWWSPEGVRRSHGDLGLSDRVDKLPLCRDVSSNPNGVCRCVANCREHPILPMNCIPCRGEFRGRRTPETTAVYARVPDGALLTAVRATSGRRP